MNYSFMYYGRLGLGYIPVAKLNANVQTMQTLTNDVKVCQMSDFIFKFQNRKRGEVSNNVNELTDIDPELYNRADQQILIRYDLWGPLLITSD